MSIPRQSVRDYIEACEELMKLEDCTDAEIEAIQEMSDRLAEKFDSEHDGEP